MSLSVSRSIRQQIDATWSPARGINHTEPDPASQWRQPELSDWSRPLIRIGNERFQSSQAAATMHRLGPVRATDLDGNWKMLLNRHRHWLEVWLRARVRLGAAALRTPADRPCG